MKDVTYPLYPIASFLGFVLAIIPLPWHLQAWNSGTILFMAWTAIGNLNGFINSVVWSNDAIIRGGIWCDISAKLIIGIGVGIPASALCISRRLYKILSMSAVSITWQEKRRAVLEDVCIGVGLPVVVMVLHVIVQGHRFNIVEQVGCNPSIVNNAVSYPLIAMWPIVLGVTSFVYSARSLHFFVARRAQFSQLAAANRSMSISRYLRLVLLACVEMLCSVPISAFSIYLNTYGVPLQPWVSWAYTHQDFGRIDQIPAILWRSDHTGVVAIELNQWIYPFCAIVFFALFGFADEARKNYAYAARMVAKWLGLQSLCKPKPAPGFILADRKGVKVHPGNSYPAQVLSMSALPIKRTPSELESGVRTSSSTLDFADAGEVSKAPALPHHDLDITSSVYPSPPYDNDHDYQHDHDSMYPSPSTTDFRQSATSMSVEEARAAALVLLESDCSYLRSPTYPPSLALPAFPPIDIGLYRASFPAVGQPLAPRRLSFPAVGAPLRTRRASPVPDDVSADFPQSPTSERSLSPAPSSPTSERSPSPPPAPAPRRAAPLAIPAFHRPVSPASYPRAEPHGSAPRS